MRSEEVEEVASGLAERIRRLERLLTPAEFACLRLGQHTATLARLVEIGAPDSIVSSERGQVDRWAAECARLMRESAR